jgi:4-amino-4-deoxy-L-arabinose transferase-like glycosyltransferase
MTTPAFTAAPPENISPKPHPRTSTSARWTFITLAAALLPVMLLASFDFGVTWDEKARHRNGELIWDYLNGRLARSDFPEDGGHLYGGLFDVICVVVERWLPFDRYVTRHMINAIFGWLGVVYGGRLAARLFGGWSGVLAMVLLASSPRYFAESMNNPKDLPFAALAIVALYYMSTISPKWPYLAPGTIVKLIVPLALALNIRAGALLYLGYFGLLIGLYVAVERVRDWRRLADTALRVAAVSAGMLVLGTAFWPWAQASPFTRPIEALLGFANFPYGGLVLFNGIEYGSTDLPWYYISWWLLISSPLVVILGVLLSLRGRRDDLLPRLALWFVATLPMAMVVVNHSTLYDGFRHLLFVYPPLVVIAAAGWSAWLSAGRHRWTRGVAAALLAAGLLDVLVYNVRGYPNQTAYFNELVGGAKGAFARYDLDHWGNCVFQAVSWSARVAQLSGRPVTVSGNPWHIVELDAARFRQLAFTLPQRNQDYLTIRLNRGPIGSVKELAARPDALYRVTTPDGAVLCVVHPGPAFGQLQPHLVLPQD